MMGPAVHETLSRPVEHRRFVACNLRATYPGAVEPGPEDLREAASQQIVPPTSSDVRTATWRLPRAAAQTIPSLNSYF